MLRSLLIDNYDSYTYNLFQLLAEASGVPPLVFKNDEISLEGVVSLVEAGKVHNVVISPGPGTPHSPHDIGVCLDVLRHLPHVPVLGVCLGHQALAAAHGAHVIKAPEPVHGRLSELQHSGHPLMHHIPSGPQQGFDTVRYHSLIVDAQSLPPCLEPIAWTCGSHHAVCLAHQPSSGKHAASPLDGGHLAAAHSQDQAATRPPASLAEPPSFPAPPSLSSSQTLAGESRQPTVQQPYAQIIMGLAHRSQPHFGVQFHPESISTRFGCVLLSNFLRITAAHLQLHQPLRPLSFGPDPPGRTFPPKPWPTADFQEGIAPLQLVWERLEGLLAPGGPGGTERLFSHLFEWAPCSFWLDRLRHGAGRAAAVPRRTVWPAGVDGAGGGAGSKQVFDVSNKQLLSFSVCNSMAEQRLAIVSGTILAFELGRVVMLPDLLVDGAEGPDRGRTMPFAQMYDADHFISALAEKGMEVVDPHRAFPKELFTPSYIPEVADPVEELALKHRTTKHLHVECPLHRLPRVYYTGANSRIMWAVLDALQPSKDLAQHVKVMLKELNRQTHHSAYSFLHLPINADWLKACSATVNSTAKNNCRGNVESIDLVLLNFNVPVTEPLYVSADWAKVSPEAAEMAMKKLQVYKVYTSKDFKPQLSGEVEVNALVEYHVAMSAHMFLGNALHPFSAVSIVHRRHRNQWASYYNGGHMPLVDLMPLDQLAWVFTSSSETPHLDYLVRAMVRSALQHRTLRPFCIFSGPTSSPIAQWLAAQGVTLITHTFSWADDLWAMAEPLAAQNERVSPIFGSKAALVDDYMRLELPLIEVLNQHVYVLFTESDVFFHKRIMLSMFSRPDLPELVGMTPDSDVSQGVDGSFMIANLLAMRDSYSELKAFVLSSKDGGLFASQGVGAAGALHAFAQGPSKRAMLSQHFAAKPFQDIDPIAFVVHFKGPKPHNYMDFFRTDRCEPEAYGNACEEGLTRSLCPYIQKWHMLLDDSEDEVGLNLWYACLALYAPHLRGLSRHRLAQH